MSEGVGRTTSTGLASVDTVRRVRRGARRPARRGARRGLRAGPRAAAPSAGRRRRATRPRCPASPPPRRRAGPSRAGPVARPCGRAGRGRPGHRLRRPRHQAGHRGDHRRRDRGAATTPTARTTSPAAGTSSRARWRPSGRAGLEVAGPALPGRRRLDRRLHRRAAARRRGRGRRGRRRLRPARLAAAAGRAGAWSTTAPTSASSPPRLIGGPVDVVVGDLSFISLLLVLEPCSA